MPNPLEKDTCREIIIPALKRAGWREDQIISEFPVEARRVLTTGGVERELGDGRVDYVLEIVPGLPVAVVEAKRYYREAREGQGQALRYAQQLDTPLAYTSNGRSTVEMNLETGEERDVEGFRTPAEALADYLAWAGLDEEQVLMLQQPFNRNKRTAAGVVVRPRWYQQVAVNRVLTRLAQGDKRLLLLMATGTGKTFTAMQIVQKLRSWNRLANPRGNYRVLYLADRDALVEQPIRKDFGTAFGRDPIHRVGAGNPGTSRDIIFATYQSLASGGDVDDLFRSYPSDFFDLVIVDECHRGSADEASSWRRILEHFSSAAQLGLTATPKQDETIDTYRYFGEPVFSYSLRQGIQDGYLAPYRVRRVVLSPDAEGWEPDPDEVDVSGQVIEPGVYGTRDFERTVRLLARTRLAAQYVMGRLRERRGRAIIFCYDMEHAERMRRDLVALAPDWTREDPEWVVRITADQEDRKRLIDDLSDPERDSPLVATTSRLLATGIDVEDLRYVVIVRPVGSAVEFKQIVGRGTRLYPDKVKTHFEIIDFVGASAHFQDPDFDGYPEHTTVETVDGDGCVIDVAADPGDDPTGVGEPVPPFTVDDPSGVTSGQDGPSGDGMSAGHDGVSARTRYVVEDGDFEILAETLQVPDTSTGQLRLTSFGSHVAHQVQRLASSPSELAQLWASPRERERAVAVLREGGLEVDQLAGPSGGDVDLFDLLVHLAWNQPTRTRAERARQVRKRHHEEIERQTEAARNVFEALLTRYEQSGIDEVTSPEVLNLPPLSQMGSRRQVIAAFGGGEGWRNAISELQRWIYSTETAS
ncbi:DEAD/DEAH box helicase family protein [Luteococcus sediminum]